MTIMAGSGSAIRTNPRSLTQRGIEEYTRFFTNLSDEKFPPYDYQLRVAESLFRRESLVLRAPTGAGKTISVLAPFLFRREAVGAARLIYALPLRTLAQGIYCEARKLCQRLGDGNIVTMQTGEQPDDPFFALGDIIVTTYDQVLSGMLCAPYGLPRKLRNINGATAAGNLVVFDEFHLMRTELAFLTAVSCLKAFGKATRSVWMTATATAPLVQVLAQHLNAQPEGPTHEELNQLPSVARVSRKIYRAQGELTAEAVLAHPDARNLVIVNRVSRAQALGRQISDLAKERGLPAPEILHARFFAPDRTTKQANLDARFGRKSRGPAILITTQVVEAGIDITSDHLHTELCPMNALVQRAGRCARFPGDSGIVHVYRTNGALPYTDSDLDAAWAILPDEPTPIDPTTAAAWVDAAHHIADEETLQRHKVSPRSQECRRRIWNSVVGQDLGGVADLIREQSDSIRVVVSDGPRLTPSRMEGVSLYRNQLHSVMANGAVWVYDSELGWVETRDESMLTRAYAVAVRRQQASYTTEYGLKLGSAGERESPTREPPPRPGHRRPLSREPWVDHTQAVMSQARQRLERECPAGGLLSEGFGGEVLATLIDWTATLHDIGKLQRQWQQWAEAVQLARNSSYRHTELLAHTDFDPNDTNQRALARTIQPGRPHHSTASAYYGFHFLEQQAPELSPSAKAACIAAVLGHHGGWSEDIVLPLDPRSRPTLGTLRADLANVELLPPSAAAVTRLLEAQLRDLCILEFEAWWPLAAYLTRTLRLSDQTATEEANRDG
jgi:CRISPR-associated endonuclease/helicase Cas3